MKNKCKKGDLIIFSVIAAIGLSALFFFYRGPHSGSVVKIYVDSQEHSVYSLSAQFQKDVEIQSKYGYNKIRICGSQISIIESDCANHDCIQMGTASKSGDILVCLPHRLFVRIEGGDQIDAVSY